MNKKQKLKAIKNQAKKRFKYSSHNQAGDVIQYTFKPASAPYNPRAMPVKGYRLDRDGMLSDIMMKYSTACGLLRVFGNIKIVPVIGR